MFFVILSIGVTVGCTVGILFIVWRHVRILASIDVDAIPAERDARVKRRLIETRIQRKVGEFQQTAAFILLPLQALLGHVGHSFHKAYRRLLSAREHHRKLHSIGGMRAREKEDPKTKEEMLAIAFVNTNEEKFLEAEKLYISVIAEDKKSLEAYQGLAALYSAQKEWDQAREVLLHLIVLYKAAMKSPERTEGTVAGYTKTLFKLGEVYEVIGEYEKALDVIKKAHALEKNNPRFLNAIVELSILCKQRIQAERALVQLEKSNPENNKLSEFERRISKMPY